MTLDQRREELMAHTKRLVTLGLVSSRDVIVNEYAGTVINRDTGDLLHYESGVTVIWAPWRPQFWMQA